VTPVRNGSLSNSLNSGSASCGACPATCARKLTPSGSEAESGTTESPWGSYVKYNRTSGGTPSESCTHLSSVDAGTSGDVTRNVTGDSASLKELCMKYLRCAMHAAWAMPLK